MTRVELHKMKRKGGRVVWLLRWWGTDGKRLGETIGEVGTMSKRDAERMQREKQSLFDGGEVAIDKPKEITLTMFEKWHRDIARAELSEGSLLECDHAFKWAIRILGGNTKLSTLTAGDVARLQNAMDDAKRKPPTIHKTLSYLRKALNRAIKHKALAKGGNPFVGFKVKGMRSGGNAKAGTIRTRDEIKRLKAAAPDCWWRAAIGLWFTGLRQEEALTLKWADVDFTRKTVTIRDAEAGTFEANGVKYPLLAWTPKTANSHRIVPVADDTMAALKELRKTADGSPYAFLGLDRLAAIQAKQEGGKWRADCELVNNCLRDWKALQARTLGKGAAIATLHDCRKSFATNALEAGIMPQEVADIIGDSVEVVMRFYAKARPDVADRVRLLTDDGPLLKLAG